MNPIKTKSLESIEQKMHDLDENSVRYHALQCAKDFKTSWIELGRCLFSVWRDKMFKEWGYTTFEAYTAKEIGIRQPTAMKLLKSYSFLEKEEPRYLQQEYSESAEARCVPSYEAVNVLRMAKNNKALDEDDYRDIKKRVFELGKDPAELRKDLTSLIRQRQEPSHEEAWRKNKTATMRRFVTTLKNLTKEMTLSKVVSSSIVKQAESLISKMEEALETGD